MKNQYNLNNPAVKRILREIKEMEKEKSSLYYAKPMEDDIFEWHFTIRGPKESEFEGGIYHGRILLPPDYPFKPPNFVLLTPNGRFEVQKKICLTISAHHPEYWQPSWSIRTVLVALIGFMPTKGEGAIGSVEFTPEERKELVRKSINWVCNRCCTANYQVLPDEKLDDEESVKIAKEFEQVKATVPPLNLKENSQDKIEIPSQKKAQSSFSSENVYTQEPKKDISIPSNDSKASNMIPTISTNSRDTSQNQIVQDYSQNNSSAWIDKAIRTLLFILLALFVKKFIA